MSRGSHDDMGSSDQSWHLVCVALHGVRAALGANGYDVVAIMNEKDLYLKSSWPAAPFPPLTVEQACANCIEANAIATGLRLDEIPALLRRLAEMKGDGQ